MLDIYINSGAPSAVNGHICSLSLSGVWFWCQGAEQCAPDRSAVPRPRSSAAEEPQPVFKRPRLSESVRSRPSADADDDFDFDLELGGRPAPRPKVKR